MIKIATSKDILTVARMMMALYKEIQPQYATDDLEVYAMEVRKHIQSPTDTLYVAEGGFFIVRDETEPMTPNLHRYNGIRVFIAPSYRNGSLLARFYDRLFTDFPNGEIMGITEINSEHIKVLDKRHTLIAKVYRLNRS